MHDDPVAAERRRQFANTLFIVAGFSAARGLMEAAWTLRGAAGVVARRARVDAAVVAVPAAAGRRRRSCSPDGFRSSGAIARAASSCTRWRARCSGSFISARSRRSACSSPNEPMTLERLSHAFFVAIRLLLYLDVLTYWAIVGMYLALHYSNLRTSLAEARLAALRAQLNPAFSVQHAQRDFDARAQRRSAGGDGDDRPAERPAACRARRAHGRDLA